MKLSEQDHRRLDGLKQLRGAAEKARELVRGHGLAGRLVPLPRGRADDLSDVLDGLIEALSDIE